MNTFATEGGLFSVMRDNKEHYYSSSALFCNLKLWVSKNCEISLSQLRDTSHLMHIDPMSMGLDGLDWMSVKSLICRDKPQDGQITTKPQFGIML